jgi:signal transduction histidine kinase
LASVLIAVKPFFTDTLSAGRQQPTTSRKQQNMKRQTSRELHDLIAQTLTGINLQLAMLKSKAISDTKEFYEKLELTRQLVEKSVDAVHRFARDLRPRHERACGNGRRQVSCGVRAGKGNHGGVTEM